MNRLSPAFSLSGNARRFSLSLPSRKRFMIGFAIGTPLTVLDQPFEIATHAPDRPSEQDQHGRVSVSQPVHRDRLFDPGLFEGWRQAITTDSSPVTRFAELIAEHQLEPALRTFVFPFPESSHEVGRDWNCSYPLLCLGVEPAVLFWVRLTLHFGSRHGAAKIDRAAVKKDGFGNQFRVWPPPRWLAHILRLGVLPQGYIYPKEERAVRDLLRKRGQMVRQRTANLLSIQNLITRNTGSSIRSNRIKTLDAEQVDDLLPNSDLALAVKANLAMIKCADEQIDILERTVTDRVKLRAEFSFLKTVPGIGQILALTIMLETGDIKRFSTVGD